MKLTKSKLKQIIKEELKLIEIFPPDMHGIQSKEGAEQEAAQLRKTIAALVDELFRLNEVDLYVIDDLRDLATHLQNLVDENAANAEPRHKKSPEPSQLSRHLLRKGLGT